jgi:ATP synthase protein I
MFTGKDTGTRRLARVQAGLAPILALAAAGISGIEAGLAVLYGGLVAVAVSAVLVWRERQAMRHPEWDQHRLLKLFVRAGIERLVLLSAMLIVGLVVLDLAPLPLLLGLMSAQLAWLVVAAGKHGK